MLRARAVPIAGLLLLLAGSGCVRGEARRRATVGHSRRAEVVLELFCGSAVRPPVEEAMRAFERREGVRTRAVFGGSGIVLSQAMTAKVGDVYIPGSDDYMDKAERKGVVVPGTRRIVCWLVPSIVVPKGNPKGIRSLEDLTKPGIRVGIAMPGKVCLGDVAMEAFRRAGIWPKVRRNIVTEVESCSKTCALVQLRQVDAVIGWDIFERWAPEDVEAIPLPSRYAHLRHVPAAILKFTKHMALAKRFVEFISGPEGRAIFRRHGYTVDLRKLRRGAGEG